MADEMSQVVHEAAVRKVREFIDDEPMSPQWRAHFAYVAAMADAAPALARLVRNGRPLADVSSPEGLQWMLDARAALALIDQARKGE